MAACGGGLCKTSRFRWLCLVRCVVATVVTVLAAVVVVKAASVMLHPQKLQLTIPSSTVLIRRISNNSFFFSFYVEATNLRDHAFIYYNNVTAGLVDSNASFSRTIAEFNLTAAITLSQGQKLDYYISETTHNMELNQWYVQKFFSNNQTSSIDVSMVLDGSFLIDYAEGTVGRSYNATYNCAPLKLISNIADLPTMIPNKNTADCAPYVL